MQYLSELEILDQLKALAEQPNFKSAFKTFFYQEWDYEIDLAEYIADQYDDLNREDVQDILEKFDDVDDVISEIYSSIRQCYKERELKKIKHELVEHFQAKYDELTEEYQAKFQVIAELDSDALKQIQSLIKKIAG